MTIETDLNALAGIEAQVCVVGSGPVGACLAIDLVERGLSVVVLESGGRRPRPGIQALSDAEIEEPRFHEVMSHATCRALGGTSWLWGGRCTSFEDISFEPRDYVPNSDWPISLGDISPFYPRAAELIGVGPGTFRRPQPLQSRELEFDKTELWANETRICDRLRQFAAFERIRFVLDATVVDLEIDEAARSVSGLVVANKRQRITFRGAKHYVLALGGVETTRFLLNVQLRRPDLFGGADGPLGRFYMGHISGKLGDIRFSSPDTARQFCFQSHPESASRARIRLSDAAQQRLRLPDVAFWPDNPELANPAHGSGFLSLAYLMVNLPALGSMFLPEALRKTELATASDYGAHLRNCVSDLRGVVRGSSDYLRQKLRDGRRVPRWFEVNETGVYRLHYHGEQIPSADNRISLAREQDALGMQRAAIRLAPTAQDIDGIYRSHEVLDRSLREAGVGAIDFRVPRDAFLETRGACLPDGLHQIGTTRMARDPSRGVVDADSRVFDFSNLFLAGSSIFCSSGQANPTFPAVALALRLGAHLDEKAGRRATPIAAPKAPRLKILHVVPSVEAASGGPARAVFDIALAAQQRGHEVTICATNFGGSSVEHSEYLKAGIKVFVFPIFGPPPMQYSREMEHYLKDNIARFDLVHLHSLYLPPDWMVYRHAVAQRIPYILRPHGTFDPVIRERKRLPKWILGKLFQDSVTAAAAGLHYTSEDERRLSNCSNLKAWVVPLPIRPEEFAGDPDPDFLKRYEVRPHFILFLGRLAWKKGADIAIRAFAEFAHRHPEIDLVIAGPDSGEEKNLRQLASRLGLDRQVRFTGMLDGPARVAAYKLAKIFVLPSRGENFGRTVAEAMLAGTPIVMSDRIGIWKDLVRHNAACVVDCDDPSILAGLRSLWDAYPEAMERARRARQLVESYYSIATVGEQLEQMYYAALGDKR
jgi:glycosyltransferase involved in cell wall biosynthesis/choline dehydrogenase-like flavoprotein